MNERIKKLRKALDLTQQEFADRIGMKRNTIASYEINRNGPSNSVISLICKAFNVSESWLRTGEGEMFRLDGETAVDRLCAELHADELETEIIRAYFRVDEKIRLPFLRRLIQEVGNHPAVPPPQPDIAAELAEFKRQNREMAAKMAAMEEELALLEAEEGYEALSSVSDGSFSVKK